ncbi:MAG: heme-binding protein [Rhodospirillales bacterium]
MAKLTLSKANSIIRNAIKTARANNAPEIAVVVLDDHGHIVAVQREDGASMFRVDVSLGKAWGSVAMGEPSRQLAKKAASNPNFIGALSTLSGGKILPNPGGVLIRDKKNKIVGAVGISGDTGANDEIFAIAGIEAAGLVADNGEK